MDEELTNETLLQSKVEALLRQRIGLNPASVGSRSIMRAVKKGMRAGKMQATSDYLTRLEKKPEVFKALVESIVVPETSFFRNRDSFVFLRRWIAQEWLKNKAARGKEEKNARKVLRVLSVPCSTGEEPYSIAIALKEEGLALNEFHIDAVDISEQAIAKAKKGIYSPYAFRRQTYRSDDKYFRVETLSNHSSKRKVQRYYLNDIIRNKVIFTQGNLLSDNFMAHRLPYDIIFCRNLLIYFDKPARDRAFAFFNRTLKPGGLLFLGYAETGLIDPKRYKPVPYPHTFAYYRREQALTQSPRHSLRNGLNNNRKSVSPPKAASAPATISTAFPNSVSSSSPAPPALPIPFPKQPDLAIAQRLADGGDIERATEQCDLYLRYFPAEAKAHLLKGELYQARDDLPAAESCFEKAIYLDPQLTEALLHLMLIKESQGAFGEVEIIRERIRRIEKK